MVINENKFLSCTKMNMLTMRNFFALLILYVCWGCVSSNSKQETVEGIVIDFNSTQKLALLGFFVFRGT